MNSTIQRQSQIFGNYEAPPGGGLNKFVTTNNLTESFIAPNTGSKGELSTNPTFSSGVVTNELTLEMENTFEKKKN